MAILVVGGAGYIGSHMVSFLLSRGYTVVVLDDLSTGYKHAVENVIEHEGVQGLQRCTFIEGNCGDQELLNEIFEQTFNSERITAVMHFASNIEVGESVDNPLKYYKNNVGNTLNLIDSMLQHQVNNFIFSSTAAVYGEPQYIPLDEEHQCAPINPYGKTKWMVEQILRDYAAAYHFHFAALRYFNACGAHPHGHIGEQHIPESHLIPLILQAASGRRESISIFGDDYPTIDGTCVRDYVHVQDLASAHLLALRQLEKEEKSFAVNLGNGVGFSVQEVIEVANRVTGREIKVFNDSRRPGDPASLVTSSGKAKRLLGWTPERSDLEQIIEDAWRWELKLAALGDG